MTSVHKVFPWRLELLLVLTVLLYVLGQLNRDVGVARVVMLGALFLDGGLSRGRLPESRL